MKKLVILGAGLLLAAGAVFFATHNKPLTAEEALMLANVEAIASGESGGNYNCCEPWSATCGYEGGYELLGVKYSSPCPQK